MGKEKLKDVCLRGDSSNFKIRKEMRKRMQTE